MTCFTLSIHLSIYLRIYPSICRLGPLSSTSILYHHHYQRFLVVVVLYEYEYRCFGFSLRLGFAMWRKLMRWGGWEREREKKKVYYNKERIPISIFITRSQHLNCGRMHSAPYYFPNIYLQFIIAIYIFIIRVSIWMTRYYTPKIFFSFFFLFLW